MRRMQRIVLLTAFVMAMPVLAGCSSFDPDSLDIFGLSEKKKLPGERRPVFPEGVPGVTQGVPPQLVKGNQPAPDAALLPPADAPPPAAAPAEEPKPAPKPKRKVAAKPKPVTAAPVQPVSQEPQQQQAQPQQAWPPTQSAAPSSGASAAWPAPPPAGTFSR
jgi:outer membrane biosynthesis protein TonB